ncbi:Hypothetical_protein [Hexamita inflata]|uniref:Hypothetical_protein n=1 Tax=Hexamita inflata TaxID=28002 RepID=A0AA86NHM8_9EUKA|nr:Hypothetical protein HINF_LOCUS7782 [Hexamita inflata]
MKRTVFEYCQFQYGILSHKIFYNLDELNCDNDLLSDYYSTEGTMCVLCWCQLPMYSISFSTTVVLQSKRPESNVPERWLNITVSSFNDMVDAQICVNDNCVEIYLREDSDKIQIVLIKRHNSTYHVTIFPARLSWCVCFGQIGTTQVFCDKNIIAIINKHNHSLRVSDSSVCVSLQQPILYTVSFFRRYFMMLSFRIIRNIYLYSINL